MQSPSAGEEAPEAQAHSAKRLAGTDFSEVDRKRFWAMVDVGGRDDCWPWKGTLDRDGYGRSSLRTRRSARSHRVCFAIARGDIPSGMCVCHSCDNRKCCNPAHLWLGTNAQNTFDRHAKGRDAKGDRSGSRKYPWKLPRGVFHHAKRNPGHMANGEQHGRAKLTKENVWEIRASLESSASLARKFGVTWPTVDKIKRGINWKYLI